MKKIKGFTMIEILVVIIIIIMLVGLLMPAIRKARKDALIKKAEAEMSNLASILTMVKGDTGYYVRLCDLSTTDTTANHPYIFGSDGTLEEITGTGETKITVWDGPYQVFQPKATLSSTNGSRPIRNNTTLPNNVWGPGSGTTVDPVYFPNGAPLDPWGHPYGIAYYLNDKCMFIISAGPDGEIDTDTGLTPLEPQGDDLLYKFR